MITINGWHILQHQQVLKGRTGFSQESSHTHKHFPRWRWNHLESDTRRSHRTLEEAIIQDSLPSRDQIVAFLVFWWYKSFLRWRYILLSTSWDDDTFSSTSRKRMFASSRLWRFLYSLVIIWKVPLHLHCNFGIGIIIKLIWIIIGKRVDSCLLSGWIKAAHTCLHSKWQNI